MRHEPTPKELCDKADEFASQFVESTGDLISLSNAISRAVQYWFKRHENMPESEGE